MARRFVGIEATRRDVPQKHRTPSDDRRDRARLQRRIEEAFDERQRRQLEAEKLRRRAETIRLARKAAKTYGRSKVEGEPRGWRS